MNRSGHPVPEDRSHRSANQQVNPFSHCLKPFGLKIKNSYNFLSKIVGVTINNPGSLPQPLLDLYGLLGLLHNRSLPSSFCLRTARGELVALLRAAPE